MAENRSDLYGRSLERAITLELGNFNGFSLTARAIQDNMRDKGKFDQLSKSHQFAYNDAAKKVLNWLQTQYPDLTKVEVDRLPDDGNNPTDICLSHSDGNIQLSIKHNHDALKHPRPYALAQWIGFAKNSPEDKAHRKLMDVAATTFRRDAAPQGEFNTYPEQVHRLYRDVCNACITTINKNNASGRLLFESLVNPSGFHKVIVRTRKQKGTVALSSLEIHDYYDFDSPTRVTATSKSWNTISLKFNNDWIIDLRVHTASSRISSAGQLSLKFDAQKEKGLVTSIQLV